MQSQEFDKLIHGEPAKWATFSKSADDLSKSQPSLKSLSKPELLEQIKENEVEIPEEIQSEINTFILLLLKLNVKEREIRRRVKARFNITVA